MSRGEVARLLGLGTTMVDLEIKAGRLRAVRHGARVLVPLSDALSWIERKLGEPFAP